MNFKIVFDYDGVLFKNSKGMNMVSERATEYVSDKLNVSYSEARRINKIQYKIHGHTVKFLQKNGIKTSMEEFNDYVYGGLDWKEIERNLDVTDVMRFVDLSNLNNFQRQKSILFSNAPEFWVNETLNIMGGNTELFFDDVYCAESIYELKPNPCNYDLIERNYPNDKLLFIDDTLLNVSNLGERWATRHFKDTDNVFEVGTELIQTGANCYI